MTRRRGTERKPFSLARWLRTQPAPLRPWLGDVADKLNLRFKSSRDYLRRAAEAALDINSTGELTIFVRDLVGVYCDEMQRLEEMRAAARRGEAVDLEEQQRRVDRLLRQAKALAQLPRPLTPVDPRDLDVGATFARAMAEATRVAQLPPQNVQRRGPAAPTSPALPSPPTNTAPPGGELMSPDQPRPRDGGMKDVTPPAPRDPPLAQLPEYISPAKRAFYEMLDRRGMPSVAELLEELDGI
jgi:hypothetical protein